MKRLLAFALAFMLLLCGCGAPAEDVVNDNVDETPDEALDEEEIPKYGPDDKLIALSFDDGPNTTVTVEILDILEEYDIVATFFVIGNNINDESAEIMKRAYEMGCEIGNHSKSHQQMGNMTPDQVKEEIDFVQQKVYEYIEFKPVLFRPPYLNVSQTMHDNIENAFIFGRDSLDWTDISAEERAQNVLGFAEDGIIVLMHDFAGNFRTPEALKTIIPELMEQGYKFVTISELFEAKGVTPEAHSGVIYSDVYAK